MPDDTLTLKLDGEVSLDQFARAVENFKRLVAALTAEVSKGDKVQWTIAGLDYGSASATVQGSTPNREPEPVLRVIRAYTTIGQALERGLQPPFSPRVTRPARVLAGLPDDKLEVVRFVTAIDASELRSNPTMNAPVLLHRAAYGAIQGRVQTLSETRGLRFVLYDVVTSSPVSCYLREDHREIMRGVWGRKAIVEGLVTRDTVRGFPVAVRQVTSVEVLPEVEPGTYKSARGVLPRAAGEPTPEERVRALRDAD